MNKCNYPAQIIALLLAAISSISTLRAQPAMESGSRYLFIFETSGDMKRRVPLVNKALDEMLALNINSELDDGDSIGIWTFNQTVHAGEFPLQIWQSQNAAAIAGRIKMFLDHQHYAKEGRFDAALPLVERLVKHSEQLTVMVFCDGEQEIHGTPFDTGINQVFRERQRERRKTKEPFIVTLRSELGKFTGCTVSFPPQPLSLPEFPPLPEPTNAPSKSVATAPAKPEPTPPVAPPLIIIGTQQTNKAPEFVTQEPTPKPVAPTNAPPTNAISEISSNLAAISNLLAAARTNTAVSPESSESGGEYGGLIFGLGLLVAAGILVVVLRQRARENSGTSLITHSFDAEKKEPPKN